MTVYELKQALEFIDDDLEVRLWTQPNYPLEYSIGDVVEHETEDAIVVYLTEGAQLGYAPRDI